MPFAKVGGAGAGAGVGVGVDVGVVEPELVLEPVVVPELLGEVEPVELVEVGVVEPLEVDEDAGADELELGVVVGVVVVDVVVGVVVVDVVVGVVVVDVVVGVVVVDVEFCAAWWTSSWTMWTSSWAMKGPARPATTGLCWLSLPPFHCSGSHLKWTWQPVTTLAFVLTLGSTRSKQTRQWESSTGSSCSSSPSCSRRRRRGASADAGLNVDCRLNIDRRCRRSSVAHPDRAWHPTLKGWMLHSTYMGRLHSTHMGCLDMHVNKNAAPVASREEDASLEIFEHGLKVNPTP